MTGSPIPAWREEARADAAKALRDLAVELDADGHPAKAAIYREQADDIATPSSTAYIVTSGSYSDYSIRSVWRAKDDAEKAAPLVNGDVEEWELNVIPAGATPKESFFFEFDSDGNCTHRRHDDDRSYHEVSGGRFATRHSPHSSAEVYACWIWAEDEEHAFKIATDMRTRALAEREGIS